MSVRLAALSLSAAFMATAVMGQTAPYTIIDIGDFAPTGEFEYTNATGLNELGHVAAVTGAVE